MSLAWLNGAPEPAALATHRGLHYGDGVFRTCLIHQGEVVELDRQLGKLEQDALRLELGTDRAALEREAQALARGSDRGVLKILLLRSGGERGYRSEARSADRLLCRYPLPQYRETARGIRATRAHFRLSTQTTLAGIKHLNRLEQVLATRHFPDGVDEMVLEDAEGRPHCGTRTNLFWVTGGIVRTAPTDRCGVSGLTRERVLSLSVGAEVAPGSFEELEASQEMFFTNSLVGIWPVGQFGERRFEAPGPVTEALMAGLRHPVAR